MIKTGLDIDNNIFLYPLSEDRCGVVFFHTAVPEYFIYSFCTKEEDFSQPCLTQVSEKTFLEIKDAINLSLKTPAPDIYCEKKYMITDMITLVQYKVAADNLTVKEFLNL